MKRAANTANTKANTKASKGIEGDSHPSEFIRNSLIIFENFNAPIIPINRDRKETTEIKKPSLAPFIIAKITAIRHIISKNINTQIYSVRRYYNSINYNRAEL